MPNKINPNHVACCCCGQASMTLKGNGYRFGECCCDNYKKPTGCAIGLSVYFKDEQVLQQRGVMNIYNIHTENPKSDHSRFSCSICNTTLYWVLSNSPDVIGVVGSCFTLPILFMPINDKVEFRITNEKQYDYPCMFTSFLQLTF